MFSRIKRNTDKFGGQPYIKDTDITVNQILTQSLQGKSISQIVEQYPPLEVEDIHQALAFSVQDIVAGVSYWRHDGMTPLTQIKGYSEILVGKTEFDDLDTIPNDQKQQWMSIIHTSSQRGIARWQQMRQWINTQCRNFSEDDTEVYQLERFIHNVVHTANDYEPTLEITVDDIPHNLSIDIHTDTTTLLGSLLASAKNTFKPEITISTSQQDNTIVVNITRELTYPDDDITKLINTHYNPFATAFMFFSMQKIDFSLQRQDHHVIITIQLPLLAEQSEL